MLSFLSQFSLLFLLTCQSGRATECDPVFEDCSGSPPVEVRQSEGGQCDEVFDEDCVVETEPAPSCYSINDVDSDIFTPDTR